MKIWKNWLNNWGIINWVKDKLKSQLELKILIKDKIIHGDKNKKKARNNKVNK